MPVEQRLQQLQNLLPTVTGDANYTVQQINLAAYGLNFPGIKTIVGPFQVFDFRAYLTWSLLNLSSLDKYLAAKHNFTGAKLTAEDARNMVVLTVGNAYLLVIADRARITAEEAEVANSKVSLDQATAAHDAGTSPRLDVLRAQVDYQNAQQQLIQARNGFEKDKLALARVIGLPTEQQFRLTDSVPYAEADSTTPEQAFEQALKNRKDLQGYAETVEAARLQRKSAVAEQYPTSASAATSAHSGTISIKITAPTPPPATFPSRCSRLQKPAVTSVSLTRRLSSSVRATATRSSRSIRTCATLYLTSRPRSSWSPPPSPMSTSRTRPCLKPSSVFAPVSQTISPSARPRHKPSRPTTNTSARFTSTTWPSSRWRAQPAPPVPITRTL